MLKNFYRIANLRFYFQLWKEWKRGTYGVLISSNDKRSFQMSVVGPKPNNNSDQSQRTQTIQWANQNSKQTHVTDAKRGEKSRQMSHNLVLFYIWLDDWVARVFLTNRVAWSKTKPCTNYFGHSNITLSNTYNEYKVKWYETSKRWFLSWQIKLLELRRDVGLRFLERAYQESHITINNLIQAVNARLVIWLFEGEESGTGSAFS